MHDPYAEIPPPDEEPFFAGDPHDEPDYPDWADPFEGSYGDTGGASQYAAAPVIADAVPAQRARKHDPAAQYAPQVLMLRTQQVFRSVIASLQGDSPERARKMVGRLAADQETLAFLPGGKNKNTGRFEGYQRTADAILALLEYGYAQASGGVVDLRHVPQAGNFATDVATELSELASWAEKGMVAADPDVEWFELREFLQRARSFEIAALFLESLGENGTPDEIRDLHAKLAKMPPTTLGEQATSVDEVGLSAAEVEDAYERAMAGQAPRRFSLGLRMLDLAVTRDGEPLGTIAPGEQILVGGPTGTGKTSFSYSAVRASCLDAIAQVGPHAKVALLHTEEESIAKAKGLQVRKGMRFETLKNNIDIVNVGSQRLKVVEYCYKAIERAEAEMKKYGGVITDYLPHVMFIDYIGALSGKGEKNEVESSYLTAELILRGIQAWDLDEMVLWGGEGVQTYEQYTGRQAPAGMEHHRVACIVLAQLVKQSDEALYYRPGPCQCAWEDNDKLRVAGKKPTEPQVTNSGAPLPVLENLTDKKRYCDGIERLCPPADRRVNPEDFVLANEDGSHAWALRSGDLRLLTKNSIRGSGYIANNATYILLLHRSRPVNNPSYDDKEQGRKRILDRRARLLIDKARNGVAFTHVVAEFDLQPVKGGAAQYFDPLAEVALAHGLLEADMDVFQVTGDPILPKREARNPLKDVSYV